MSTPVPGDGSTGDAAAGRTGPAAGPAFLVGRYELGELLGRGGMADVRIGVDRRLGRRVAVKQLRSDLSRDPTFQARFRREAQSAASLNHPSIVAVYDTGEHADATGAVVPFIVMEHVEGETLRDILRSGRKLMSGRALEITAEVLSALDYSHHAGIIHRDVKPANVMLTPSGRTKVMDFGIARSLADTSATMTQTAAVVGTAQYLSPEQARGESADARSDLYSTGCLLFELLTGRPPFQGDTPLSVAYQHVREEAPAPSAFNPEVTPAMDAIVGRALQKKMSDRYQSATDMRADIERALAGDDVIPPARVLPAAALTTTMDVPAVGATAAHDTAQTPHQREPRRRGYWLLALLIIALAVGAALLVPWLLDDTPAADTAVPRVVGLPLTDATRALDRAGLGIKVERRASEEPENTVLGQNPDAGTPAVTDSTVNVVVSAGPAPVEVPYVLRKTKRKATRALRADDLKVKVSFQDSDKPQGTVLNTKPEPTTQVAAGSTVVLVVSSGPVRVPRVRGLVQASAEAKLAARGFTVEVVEDPGSDQPFGVVVYQTPRPRTEATAGSNVIITVSTYVAATTVPPATPPTTTVPPTTPTTPTPTHSPKPTKPPKPTKTTPTPTATTPTPTPTTPTPTPTPKPTKPTKTTPTPTEPTATTPGPRRR